jgi:hypothetical protein
VVRWLTLILALLGAAPVLAAEADAAGSRDPAGVERYPRSWIVDYQRDADVLPRQFIMSRVDRIRRELRIDDRLWVDGSLETATYRIPEGVAVDDVAAHYADELGRDVLFRCDGRDCGRSNDWANQIFESAILYGPDRNQRYLALEWEDRMVALYVIRRGNQRVYAHLRVIEPPGSVGLEPNALLVRRLSERGWAAVDAVTPQADGSIDAAGRRVLAGLVGSLERFSGRPIHVVCHLGGAGGVALEASLRCAEEAVAVLTEAAPADRGVSLRPFGAGALLPRPNLPRSRLELVIISGP